MKNEAEFRAFLTTEKRSTRTNQPFSTKVASDTISRCKSVERLMSIELSRKTLASEDACSRICAQIKGQKLTSSQQRPYAHNGLILAVRTYREFVVRVSPFSA